MPKKFQGENSKAVVAKARKAEAAAVEKMKKDQAIEDAYWQEDDKHVNRKLARKEDREKKRQADLEKKAQLRAMAEEENAALSLAAEAKAPPQRKTAYEIKKDQERAAAANETKKEESQSHIDVPLVENLNRTTDEVVSASGIDAAITALSVDDDSSDRHPEKRMAAAFKAFEAKRMPLLKKENPNFRLSQLKQHLRKEWQKSPENPLNKRNM